MLRAALSYAARGMPVFPCEPSGKRPLTNNGFWDTTIDERQIRACGGDGLRRTSVSRPAGRAACSSSTWTPKTLRARTGRGGEHLFFRMGENWEVRNSQGLLGPGLDIRGEGGYVLVAPNRTTGPYAWTDLLQERPGSAGSSGASRSWRSGGSARGCSRPP